MDASSTHLLEGVEHLTHAAVKIHNGQTLYFDPFDLTSQPHDADLIFITHLHYDHLSPEDIKAVANPETTLIAPADAVDKLQNLGLSKVILVNPGREYTVGEITFRAIPAYNLNKHFHPKDNGWVGYWVSVNHRRYYFAGDTDYIPEMNGIRADVAFLPIGGTYTMNPEEAAQAARAIKPAVAVPIHFGKVVGTLEDAKKFVALLDPQIQGVILSKNQMSDYD